MRCALVTGVQTCALPIFFCCAPTGGLLKSRGIFRPVPAPDSERQRSSSDGVEGKEDGPQGKEAGRETGGKIQDQGQGRKGEGADRKSTHLNSSHSCATRMQSYA